MLRDIDVQALIFNARESASASVRQVTLCESADSVTARLFSDLEQHMTDGSLPEAPPQAIPSPESEDNDAWLCTCSAKAPHSSYFLLATPGPHTTLNDEEYHDAIWFRLGLCAAANHDECVPNSRDDPIGFHRLRAKLLRGLDFTDTTHWQQSSQRLP